MSTQFLGAALSRVLNCVATGSPIGQHSSSTDLELAPKGQSLISAGCLRSVYCDVHGVTTRLKTTLPTPRWRTAPAGPEGYEYRLGRSGSPEPQVEGHQTLAAPQLLMANQPAASALEGYQAYQPIFRWPSQARRSALYCLAQAKPRKSRASVVCLESFYSASPLTM